MRAQQESDKQYVSKSKNVKISLYLFTKLVSQLHSNGDASSACVCMGYMAALGQYCACGE